MSILYVYQREQHRHKVQHVSSEQFLQNTCRKTRSTEKTTATTKSIDEQCSSHKTIVINIASIGCNRAIIEYCCCEQVSTYEFGGRYSETGSGSNYRFNACCSPNNQSEHNHDISAEIVWEHENGNAYGTSISNGDKTQITAESICVDA
mmetsp:Transcript_41223/g.66304  ORF Transcript_41223/g.66304 Transcript_41223/m.66304 type:complete len:149 (-) Transcript_41223:333-779(-)